MGSYAIGSSIYQFQPNTELFLKNIILFSKSHFLTQELDYIIYYMTWQRFAKDFSGNIVDVYNISDDYVHEHGNESFICLNCGKPMLSKRGKVKEWHFAHIDVKNINCSYESYLHKLGIAKFIEAYKNRIKSNNPFLLQIATGETCQYTECPYGRAIPCGKINDYAIISPFHGFQKIEREVQDGDFIPDILLTSNDGRKIYVEIVVKHFAEPRKIASRIPIIEIELKTEGDIETLFSQDILSQHNENINMFNFDQHMIKVNYNCEKKIQKEKNEFIRNYQWHVQNKQPLIIQIDYEILCNHEDCPYIEGNLCRDFEFEEIDIASLYKESFAENSAETFSPDFVLTNKEDGSKLRFNFCYELFSNAESFNNIKTIQFNIENEFGTTPWRDNYICQYDKEIRYFNIPMHKQKNLCGDCLRKFELVVLGKDGKVYFPGFAAIDFIQHYMSQIRNNVDDYILIPIFDERKKLPSTPPKVAEAFQKSCNACLHCLDKRIVGSKKRNLTCQHYMRPCENDDALDCEIFKRNLKIQNDRACSQKYRGLEWLIKAWKRYRLKQNEKF